MKSMKVKTTSGKICWVAITIFLLGVIVGPFATIAQQPHGGDETMAAAINAAWISGAVLCVGAIVGFFGFFATDGHRWLRWTCLTLYAVPGTFGIYLLIQLMTH